MGSIIGSCAGSMFSGLLCAACRQCSGHKTGIMSRIPYIFLFSLSGIFAIFMSLYGEKELHLPFYSTKICNNNTCIGNGSVYRVSFILFVFELLHCLIIAAGALSFHWVWFGIKFIVFVSALASTFLIGVHDGSSKFFNGYADYFARYISAIYLLLQILILISWAYKINEYLQEKGNEAALPNNPDQDEDEKSHGCNWYFWTLGISTCGLYIISFILCAFFFQWYGADTGECSQHRIFISLTIVICVLNGILSGVRGDGSFFVSAVVSCYCTFLCFAALQSDDNEACNMWSHRRDSAALWLGYITTFLSIFYAAIRADDIGILWDSEESETETAEINMSLTQSVDKVVNVKDECVPDSNYNEMEDVETDEKQNENKEIEDNLSNNQQKISNVYFHFIMMLASCYLAMLFSNWGMGSKFKTKGVESMWVNIICQYATVVLYWWTLIAPMILPSRFAQQNDE